MKNFRETLMHVVFFVCALASIAAVVLICLFLFANGIPAMKEIGLLNFLTGAKWKPGNDIYGILPMILGSIYITAGAVVIGVPVGLLTAIFMAFYCPKKLYGLLKPCTELLAGIPSIVYGFFGMVVIVPCIRTVAALFGADISGSSILAASVLLGIMILPTVIGVSEAALRAVPSAYYEGAVAMGARHERAIFTVMLPAAKSGVLAGIVLGIGRAIGETMAVIMVAGNQPRLTGNMLKGIRTMTANIVMEMGYATGLHREALIATGVVLFVFILIINLTFSILKRRKQA
ncbi:phosphate ABC transporter permease subunit PstC [Agathobaculum sp.]|jgi:phosphate transport system permease protein|uniref:phosphate ABC transporter permease subunit PstC n=1 Tax=Agathobaculum sp. TaxID=2048138 RepID=UPI000E4D36AB|nr:phosphate ABC transporter permease subunit PstC [Butyricicoccus sp. AM42-5AC]